MKLVSSALVVVIAATPACKGDSAGKRAKAAATENQFWPEAPRPTVTTGARTLAYQPANITGYTMTMKSGTAPGVEPHVMAAMDLALAFRAGTSPTMREGMIKRMTMNVDATGQKMDVSYDGDVLRIVNGADDPVVIRRGDQNPAFDVGALADRPITQVEFTADGRVVPHPVDNPLGEDISLDTALVLFPDLPSGSIDVGHSWQVTRLSKLPSQMGSVDIVFTLVYTGTGPCPSGAPACANLTVSAASAKTPITVQGHTGTITYGFAGRVYLGDNGAIDESRLRMDMDFTLDGMSMSLGGVYTLKPT